MNGPDVGLSVTNLRMPLHEIVISFRKAVGADANGNPKVFMNLTEIVFPKMNCARW
jgi:hypothetical protein